MLYIYICIVIKNNKTMKYIKFYSPFFEMIYHVANGNENKVVEYARSTNILIKNLVEEHFCRNSEMIYKGMRKDVKAFYEECMTNKDEDFKTWEKNHKEELINEINKIFE